MGRPGALAGIVAGVGLVLGGTAGAAEIGGPSAGLAKLPSGISLQYVVQGKAGGECIVLLHGLGDSWHSYELVLPHLPESYRVYAVTLRGHGWSDHPPSGYKREDFAADVGQFLEQENLRNVTLVGHSLGSFVAQVVAENDRRRLRRLVLIGSSAGARLDDAARDGLRTLFGGLRDPIDPTFARDFQAGTAHRPLPAGFLETMTGEALRVPAHVWREIAAGLESPDDADKLRSIKVPTLVFWGDRDGMMTRAGQDALVAGIPKARLLVYPETGHALHWEQPERFARDLLAFLREDAGR